MATNPVLAQPVLAQPDALVVLLTVEALVFTALAVLMSLSATPGRVPALPMSVVRLGVCAAVVVSLIAVGAFAAWLSIFTAPFVSSITGITEAVAVLIGILAQPVFAFIFACGLQSRE